MPRETSQPKQRESTEQIIRIPLRELHPFPDHPYGIRDDQAISAFMDGNRILSYLLNALDNLGLHTSIQLFQVFFRFLKEFNAPTHSISTSSAASISSSVIPSSFITSSIGVEGALLSASLFVASIKSK